MKPKYLDAFTKNSETITAIKSEYAVVARWADENPERENRVGYFVSHDMDTKGVSIKKSTENSKIFGITVDSPGFAANVTKDACDVCDILPSHAYVCFSGFATVIDNGTCAVSDLCKSNEEGTAIPSTDGKGYRVIERVDDTHVLVHVELANESASGGGTSTVQVAVAGTRLYINY